MRNQQDTICAQATAPGSGGIAIVRMSGSEAAHILNAVFQPAAGRLIPRMLTYGHVLEDGEPVDEAMAVLLPGPASYTREDVAEIHCHGSPAVVLRILRLLCAKGARPAEPGEFTYRAFAAGRIDMSQAEAVMRMVRADSDRAMRSAMRQIEGGVSDFVRAAREEIITMLSALAAAIDFPDEVDERQTREDLVARCQALSARLRAAADARQGRLEDEGLRVALFGLPNAGKSSLLNALLGQERAIVTAVPGTTRDLLTERTQMQGLSVVLTDTAGLREAGDEAERIGVARARQAMEQADVRLLVIDGGAPLQEEAIGLIAEERPQLVVLAKADLPQAVDPLALRAIDPDAGFVRVSARTGEGLDALRERIVSMAGLAEGEGALLGQARHAEAAETCCAALDAAAEALSGGYETDVAAIDLTDALNALGEITGETLNERVIDAIFANFCVGK